MMALLQLELSENRHKPYRRRKEQRSLAGSGKRSGAGRRIVTFEPLERRDLLSAQPDWGGGDWADNPAPAALVAGGEGEAAPTDVVRYRLALTDTSNQPLPVGGSGHLQVQVGQTFRLHAYNQDVRFLANPAGSTTEGPPKGVFASYMDVFYTNAGLVTVRHGETQQIEFVPVAPPEGGQTPVISGQFTLTFDHQTTSLIDYTPFLEDLAPVVQQKLEALPNVGPGNVQVTLVPVTLDALRVRFLNDLGEWDAPMISVDRSRLANCQDVTVIERFPADLTNTGTFKTSFTLVYPFINGLKAVNETELEPGQPAGGRTLGSVGSFLDGYHSPSPTKEFEFFYVDLRADAAGQVAFSGNLSEGEGTETLTFPANETLPKFEVDLEDIGFVQDINHPLILDIVHRDLDWGDASDPAYPTLRASAGATHVIQSGFRLGGANDNDPNGQPVPAALGDDNDGTDDDDGVFVVGSLVRGEIGHLELQVTNTSGVGGVLDAWIDWNADGDWLDADERILLKQPVTPGLNRLRVEVPATAALGQTGARFRLSRAGMPEFVGLAPDGEVEDYQVTITSPYPDDILGRNKYGYLWVAKSNGANGFSSGIWGQWSTARTWTNLMVGDFNGDGRDDFLGRNDFGYWWVAASNGSSAFTSSIWGKWDPTRVWTTVMLGDFNGDGRDDFVGRNQFGYWWVALSNGAGAFNSAIWGKWDTARTWKDVMVGDFNGDGCSDLVARNEYGYWWVATSNGSNAFTSAIWGKWDPTRNWTDVMVGDFNGDGLDDVVGRNNVGYWWVAKSNGSNTLSNAIWGQWSTARTWTDVMVGDFDGNGAADLVGRNDYGYWWVAKSNGTGAFTNGIWGQWDNAENWKDVMVADVNRDGRSDVVGRDKSNYWWVGKSNGWDKFAKEYWGKWNAVDWFDVQGGDFGA